MIGRVNIDLGPAPDRSRHPEAMPTWAQLTRLGGDRAATLFEDLRKRVGAIDGVVEDMHYAGQKEGWVPRYCLGEKVLFTARIRPGVLEAAVCVSDSEHAGLLAARSISSMTKRALEGCRNDAGEREARFLLKQPSDVRAFSRLVVLLGRLAAKR